MRVLFTSTRGAGHVQPLLPYARAFLGRKHEVLVAAPADVSAVLRDAGLSHAAFAHPGDDTLKPIWARFRGASQDEMMAIAMGEIFAGANATAALPQLQETIVSFRPDLVVRDSSEFAALVAAEVARVPHARVAVHSVSFEEALPPLLDAPVDALRTAVGLAPDQGASLSAEAVFSSFPGSLDEVPAGSRMRPPFRARVVEDAPSAASAAWVGAGDSRPLVYITFGTQLANVPEYRSMFRASLEAVADLPVRALLTTGRNFDNATLGVIPANAQVQAWVAQRDVLAHAAALLCHGGSGTVLGGLAAGLPMVVVGHGADQPHNARLVAAAGAGLALTQADASALRAALKTVLETPEPRLRAQSLATEIAAMPTIEDAVDVMLALI